MKWNPCTNINDKLSKMATQILSIFLKFLLFFLCLVLSMKRGNAYEGGDDTKSHHLHHHTHTVQITSFLPAAVCNPSSKGSQNKRASLKVVHKLGPCSPLSQHNPTPNLSLILLQDQARVNSIHSRLSNSSQNNLLDSKTTLPVNSGNSLGTGNYVVTVGLGTPKKDLTLQFDTASDITWTQCEPCLKGCYEQEEPIFNPADSTSYTDITCNSLECSELNPSGCYMSTTCLYGVEYGDGSFTVGFFAKEKLTISSTDVFDNFLFGCGQENNGTFGGTAGLLGLGRGKLSFVSQSSQKYANVFSYCLSSSSSSSGYLSFGEDAVSCGANFTPMSIRSLDPSFYFINLIGLSVGGRKLSISELVFLKAGTIIDSGTVVTRLPNTTYTVLRSAFREGMSNYAMTESLSILDTCYDLSQYDTVSIPTIVFYFEGDVEVDVDPTGILIGGSASQLCLAIAGNSDDSDYGIFGNTQQKTFDVVYDVAGGKLGFNPGGCD